MKTRRLLTAVTSILAAACMMTVQFSALSVGAYSIDSSVDNDTEIITYDSEEFFEKVKNNEYTHIFMKDKLAEYAEEAIIIDPFYKGDDCTMAYVINPDDTIIYLVEETDIIIYTDDNTKFSLTEAQDMVYDAIGYPVGYSLGYKAPYYFNITNCSNEQVNEVINRAIENNNISKIEIMNSFCKVDEVYATNFYINSEKSASEIIDEYSSLELRLDKSVTDCLNMEYTDEYKQYIDPLPYNYYFGIKKHFDVNYSELKRLIENEDVCLEFEIRGGREYLEKEITTLYEKEPADLTYADAVKGTEEIIYGDADGNGEVELTDLTRISMAVMGDITLEGTEILAADVNGDGEVDITDIALMKQYVMGEAVKLGVQ